MKKSYKGLIILNIIISMDRLISDINSGRYKNIIILSGAGISTNAGIPDYRSSSGIFSKLSGVFSFVTKPEDLFSRPFVNKHPEIFHHPIYQEFRQQIADATPTSSHYLASYLYELGVLKKVYTQNVDGLYQKAGVPDNLIVEFHGSIIKDDVVMYGDPIPSSAMEQVKQDFVDNVDEVDLIIVMGTSLQVLPFAALPNMVRKSCCRVLVNKFPEHCFKNNWTPKHGTDKFSSLDPEPVQFTTTSMFGRKVSLQAAWNPRGKWKNQYIIAKDCDDFSNLVMAK